MYMYIYILLLLLLLFVQIIIRRRIIIQLLQKITPRFSELWRRPTGAAAPLPGAKRGLGAGRGPGTERTENRGVISFSSRAKVDNL